jgi:hypothetical protein
MIDGSDGRPTRWEHLSPDPGLVDALDQADRDGARADLLNASTGKNQWSNRFADACARMVASDLAVHPQVRRLNLSVLPDSNTAEPPTVVAGGKKKRVDVIAASFGSGLQMGFSLKGGNFRDHEGRNYDKNLTGRAYELREEMQEIHSYQPSAFMVCLYFFPLGATCDKVTGSSFAHAVQFLRARTGRTDHLSAGQAGRFDMAIIGLYVPGDRESYEFAVGRAGGPRSFAYEDPFPRGVVRYFDVEQDPPKMGRPALGTTMSLPEMVDAAVARYTGDAAAISWASPEPEHEGDPVQVVLDSAPIPEDDNATE